MSAIAKAKDAYEHIDPERVGNGTRFVVSELAGRSTIKIKADELGLPMDGAAVGTVIDELKRLEHEGYHFEAADASLELLMRRAAGLGAGLLHGRVDAGHRRRAARTAPSSPRPR